MEYGVDCTEFATNAQNNEIVMIENMSEAVVRRDSVFSSSVPAHHFEDCSVREALDLL
jgi:hypothetical protein